MGSLLVLSITLKKQAWDGATFELKDSTTTNRMA
jgi:hypothetical protein